MALVCTQCSTSNADGARFCRACGTPLAAVSADLHESSAFDSVACDDCGHLNAPGTRYCAKCGYSLVGTVIVSRREMTLPPVASTPVNPHAARPPAAPDEDTFDPLSAPTQVMHDTGTGRFSALAASAATPMPPTPRSGKGLWIGGGLGAFVLIAAGAWFVMRPAPPPKVETAAPAPATPAPAPVAPPPAQAEPAQAAAPAASVPAVAAQAAAPLAPPPAAPAAMVEPPPAAPTAVAPPPVDPAAQQAARERAAKAKAEREARAKQLAEQRDQEAAYVRAEQDAARKRTEQATAARPAPAPAPAAAPAPMQRQSVREACAGSNLLTRGLCEQRACAPAEMANDPTCVKLKEEEQKRLFR